MWKKATATLEAIRQNAAARQLRGTQRTEHAAMTPGVACIQGPGPRARPPFMREQVVLFLRKPRLEGAGFLRDMVLAEASPEAEADSRGARHSYAMPWQGGAGKRDCPRLAIAFDETAPCEQRSQSIARRIGSSAGGSG